MHNIYNILIFLCIHIYHIILLIINNKYIWNIYNIHTVWLVYEYYSMASYAISLTTWSV